MRRGREFYSENYSKAVELYKQGLSVKQISSDLGLSYSAVYHWVKGLRSPEKGNITDFLYYLKKNGPMPVVKLKANFPKHNELFLTAEHRGLGVRRHTMARKFGEYNTWYYLPGQEVLLKERLDELFEVITKVKEKLGSHGKGYI